MNSRVRAVIFLVVCLWIGLVPRVEACVKTDTRWSTTSNRLYIENPVSCTLTDIAGFVGTDVLELLDPVQHVWLLKANLILENGSSLVLHGTSIGGDVNELQLLSNNNPVQIIELKAMWGTIDVASTHITTWDPSSSGPDTDDVNGRSFIHVISYLDTNSVARESRMDITNSEIDHLGYHAAEAYGLVWKVRGSQAGLYDLVGVYGSLTNSHVHDNLMGYYSYGAQAILISNNEVDHNIMYGIDPHDDSDYLTITDNVVHDNGTHGIICSRRCNNLEISGNVVYNNRHGIMLHRDVTDTVVENNHVYDNRDTGIVLFESHFNTIRNNTVEGNKHGVRLSLGSHDNTIDSNIIRNNTENGLYLFMGSDTPETTDGRPKDNVFSNNTLSDNGRLMKVRDSDRISITNNDFSGSISDIEVYDSSAIEITGNTDNLATMEIASKGAGIGSSYVHLETDRDLTAKVDDYGVIELTNPNGRILDPDETAGMVSITPAGSDLVLNAALIQSSSNVTALPLYATTTSGSYSVFKPVFDASTHSWYASTTETDQPVQFQLTGLVPSINYSVFRNHVLITEQLSDASGVISFSDQIQPTVSKYLYEVSSISATTLNATADAYVRDGIYADQNFGTTSNLNVKLSSVDYNRVGYVSFPLNGSTPVTSANLQLMMKTSSADTIQAVVSNASGSWGETTITWNNQPGAGTTIASQTVTSTNYTQFTFDVTTAVNDAIAAGASQITFALTAGNSSTAVLKVGAREDVANAPHLILDLNN